MHHKCLFASLRRGLAERKPPADCPVDNRLEAAARTASLRFSVLARSSSRLMVVRISRCKPKNKSKAS